MNYYLICYSYDLIHYKFKKFLTIEKCLNFKAKILDKVLFLETYQQLSLEDFYS